MKHFDNAVEEVEKKMIERIFIDPYDFFSKNGKYAVPNRQKRRLRQMNVLSKGQDISNEEFQMNEKVFKPFHIIEAKTANTRSPPVVRVINSQSKVFTIINDDNIDQSTPARIQPLFNSLHPINIVSEISLKFPNFTNSKQNSLDIEKKQSSASYTNSRINTSRRNPKHQRKHKSRSNHQLYGVNRIVDCEKQQRSRGHCQRRILPDININKQQTISFNQGLQEIGEKKQQIKLSGISVMPSLRESPHNDKSIHPEMNNIHKRQISMMPSQLIHNNPISAVKKSVYQLLIKKY